MRTEHGATGVIWRDGKAYLQAYSDYDEYDTDDTWIGVYREFDIPLSDDIVSALAAGKDFGLHNPQHDAGTDVAWDAVAEPAWFEDVDDNAPDAYGVRPSDCWCGGVDAEEIDICSRHQAAYDTMFTALAEWNELLREIAGE